MNTESDIANVTLTSVVGTTFRYGTPRGGRRQRQPVDGDQVHQVHEEDPHEDRQRERRDQLVVAVERVAHGGVDEADDELDRGLELARAARS